MNEILLGDCLERLGELPDNSVDCLVTDPPYALTPTRSKNKNPKGGFMGKAWDAQVPSVEIWCEVFRVMKAGAFGFVMSSPRQDVLARMICNLQDAGFETGFSSIAWVYNTGFPKATNVSKRIDSQHGLKGEWTCERGEFDNSIIPNAHLQQKRVGVVERATPNPMTYTPQHPDAVRLAGSFAGFQPKPAYEFVLVVMKPIEFQTYTEQALDNGKGITYLDDGRIPIRNEIMRLRKGNGGLMKNNVYRSFKDLEINSISPKGRFAPNVLCQDDALNDGEVSGGETREVLKAGKKSQAFFGKGGKVDVACHTDIGSNSRYFDLDFWFEKQIELLPENIRKTFPFIQVPKPSQAEKNKGLEGFELKDANEITQRKEGSAGSLNGRSGKTATAQNTHVSVKPLKLMQYLITIGSRPNDLILDPFCGSGTTLCAAKALQRNYIGIELEKESFDIAIARVAATGNFVITDNQLRMF
jgi:site-specific DNA-methyltransferase (adenine-specific)